MTTHRKPAGPRNGRRWYEDGECAVLSRRRATDPKAGLDVLVRVVGLVGETRRQVGLDGKWHGTPRAIYDVEEVLTRERYAASDEHLRPLKSAEERAALLGKEVAP